MLDRVAVDSMGACCGGWLIFGAGWRHTSADGEICGAVIVKDQGPGVRGFYIIRI